MESKIEKMGAMAERNKERDEFLDDLMSKNKVVEKIFEK